MKICVQQCDLTFFQSEALNNFEIFGMELVESQFNDIIGSLSGNNHLESLTFKDCPFQSSVSMSFLGEFFVFLFYSLSCWTNIIVGIKHL